MVEQSWYGRFSAHKISLVYIYLHLFSYCLSMKGKAFPVPKNYAAKSIGKWR